MNYLFIQLNNIDIPEERFDILSIGEGIDVMMYLEIPTVFPACFSFLNYKVDLLPSVY